MLIDTEKCKVTQQRLWAILHTKIVPVSWLDD